MMNGYRVRREIKSEEHRDLKSLYFTVCIMFSILLLPLTYPSF